MALRARLTAWTSALTVTVLPRPRRIDVAIGVALAVLAVAEPALFEYSNGLPAAAVGIAAAGAFAVRRIRPLAAVVVAGVLQIAVDLAAWVIGEGIEPTFAAVIAAAALIYNAGRWGSTRTVLVAALLSSVVIPLVGSRNPFAEPSFVLLALDGLAAAVFLSTGLLIRIAKDAKEQRELAAALQERNQLANEIHDSFAHHMSAIAVRAEAARKLQDPAALDEALLAIKRSASTGLTDLRHLVAGIRTPGAASRPLPGLGDIHQLASDHRSNALDISVEIDAEPELIPVTTSSAAYWISREAVTNAFRHAVGATAIAIEARSTSEHLDLTITDDGTMPTARKKKPGNGLTSMAERATEIGGTLTAGPRRSGGWSVTARLPLNRGDT